MIFNIPNFNTAMLLGTWEKELHNILKFINLNNYDHIICIGAAEGYYAVGFGRTHTNSKIITYEIESQYRNLLKQLANLNDINNVIFETHCDAIKLTQLINPISNNSNLIICDVEGAEIDILDPLKIKTLVDIPILVEVHEMYQKNCEEKMVKRFCDSHEITVIEGKKRELDDLPLELSFLKIIFSKKRILNLMSEGRPYPMNWLWMIPKTK